MRIFVGLALICFLFACDFPKDKYSSFGSKFSYKLIQIGHDGPIKNGQVLFSSLIVTTLQNDTIYYVPNYPYFFPLKEDSLSQLFSKFSVGDSLIIKTNVDDLSQLFSFYKLIESAHEEVLLKIRLLGAYEKSKVDHEMRKRISKREVSEQANLKKYLKKQKKPTELISGAYRIKENETSGEAIKNGSQVTIDYKGKFLNGFVFEDTYEKGISPTFNYGIEGQLLQGVQIGLKGLKEGERVKIILPSRLAFKEEGSLAGIVPPYTAVIFEINIKKVIN